ncbi:MULTISPECIES: FAD-binding domain-containing protein [Pseudidiomarina]|nr:MULTISPECIES: FAD-binding domain-containing protein [Pseudidiomarina]
MSTSVQVVWFKRDLRCVDHAALAAAAKAGPVLALYVIEPNYWQLSDTSNRQWMFVRDALVDLQQQLAALGGQLWLAHGHVLEALSELHQVLPQFVLHSHQEHGNLWTFKRDQAVGRFCRGHQLTWHEYPQFGVVRPVQRRVGRFHEHWFDWMQQAQQTLPEHIAFVPPAWLESTSLRPLTIELLPTNLGTDAYLLRSRQQGGRREGLALLESFLTRRSERYRGSISSPLTAVSSCSRLSPYLAYGCLSLKEIVQATESSRAKTVPIHWRKSLADFSQRLWWHCYFIQRFESNHRMEFQALVPATDKLPRPFDAERFAAWQHGRTGWPMVDACMRYLHVHGWINFRMRAMLVSAATYSLSLPWRPVAEWLAQLFVDYEPGIHFPQVQMQSGHAGNSILRIYNPVMQAQKLDPQGQFVRRWVPELRSIDAMWLFEPWLMPVHLKQQQGIDYPLPLVDFELAHRQLKNDVSQLRKEHDLRPARGFNERRSRTGSRSRSRSRKNAPPDNQLSLFD